MDTTESNIMSAIMSESQEGGNEDYESEYNGRIPANIVPFLKNTTKTLRYGLKEHGDKFYVYTHINQDGGFMPLVGLVYDNDTPDTVSFHLTRVFSSLEYEQLKHFVVNEISRHREKYPNTTQLFITSPKNEIYDRLFDHLEDNCSQIVSRKVDNDRVEMTFKF